MTQVTEAIYSGGVLKPLQEVSLMESQRVRLTIEPLDEVGTADRDAALQRLLDGIARMEFRSTGRLPTRDELHDRT